jgi:hypothetical protein
MQLGDELWRERGGDRSGRSDHHPGAGERSGRSSCRHVLEDSSGSQQVLQQLIDELGTVAHAFELRLEPREQLFPAPGRTQQLEHGPREARRVAVESPQLGVAKHGQGLSVLCDSGLACEHPPRRPDRSRAAHQHKHTCPPSTWG